jgi:hypothetical protein
MDIVILCYCQTMELGRKPCGRVFALDRYLRLVDLLTSDLNNCLSIVSIVIASLQYPLYLFLQLSGFHPLRNEKQGERSHEQWR